MAGEIDDDNQGRRAVVALNQNQKPKIENSAISRRKDSAECKRWNTANLPQRVMADFVAAGSAAAMVAPVVCVIDRYVHCLPWYSSWWCLLGYDGVGK